ncbi:MULTISPECIES: hypothetical protein [unclassified Microcoleus]|uniref:hypothetical protein n=1 Tax=unclassified Microcoleus TaxID=2642155 RepID=UPI0025EFB82E|nr:MULTISPECIES: hypothetical protein [unclassified Microcoleus]
MATIFLRDRCSFFLTLDYSRSQYLSHGLILLHLATVFSAVRSGSRMAIARLS